MAFEIPEPESSPERLSEVIYAVYTAFSTGWDAISETQGKLKDLSTEAIFLGPIDIHDSQIS